MNDTKRHLLERLPGSLGLRPGHGFALGEYPSIASLPLCEPARAGEKRRIPGGTGVADTEVTCQKDDADTWAWVEAGTGTGEASLTAAWVLIEEKDVAAAASLSFNDVFSATYLSYAVMFRLTLSANAQLNMRLRVAGADESGANTYYSTVSRSGGTIANVADGSVGRTLMVLMTAPGTTNAEEMGNLLVGSPFAAVKTIVQSDVNTLSTAPLALRELGASGRNATTSYDGFSLLAASGTMTGNAKVYGIQNSIGDGFTGYTDEAARDAIGAALVAGANTTITVDDALNTITIASTGGGSSSIADILMLGGM
jgi:hypothetical protein